jgi:hypothetical protein
MIVFSLVSLPLAIRDLPRALVETQSVEEDLFQYIREGDTDKAIKLFKQWQ